MTRRRTHTVATLLAHAVGVLGVVVFCAAMTVAAILSILDSAR